MPTGTFLRAARVKMKEEGLDATRRSPAHMHLGTPPMYVPALKQPTGGLQIWGLITTSSLLT
jgi:hypothetical protein